MASNRNSAERPSHVRSAGLQRVQWIYRRQTLHNRSLLCVDRRQRGICEVDSQFPAHPLDATTRAADMTDTKDMQKIGRLAFRAEGNNWNAYYAPPKTMGNAVFLGSIAMSAAASSPELKQRFMELMRDVVGDITEEACGIRPTWGGPEPAPEHERAGQA